MREALTHAQDEGGSSYTVKEIEKAVIRLEERQKELIDLPRDPGCRLNRPVSTT
ncbi:hypothetical protein ACFOEP_13170 [Microbacterium amylolyticum]